MYVKSLEVTNYRNYKSEQAEFSPGLNIFIGSNAQGKTNLLEAVYFASVGRSPRTPRDKDLVLWGQQRAQIKLQTHTDAGGDKVELIIDKSENKRIAINSTPITRMGELMGIVPGVFFAPGEIKVVKDAPSERRSFMDIALCQMSRAYFYLLQRYNKILSQRNRLLKSGKLTDDTLDIWDMQLAENGAKIVKSRKGYIKRLEPFAKQNQAFLTDENEDITLEYDGAEGETVDEINAALLQELKKCREKDMLHGYTGAGPQKDDIVIRINKIDVRAYGSQGQLRTTALSLKLSEADLYKSESGEYPVLLLDDVLSELDKTRQQKLLQKAQSLQTILTCTHIEKDVFGNVKDYQLFEIENGKIINKK